MPGVQKPHCSAWWRRNASCSADSGPSGAASASTVSTLQPSVCAYLDQHPDPTEAQAREAISGNLCRCTGYQNIVKAVRLAAERIHA